MSETQTVSPDPVTENIHDTLSLMFTEGEVIMVSHTVCGTGGLVKHPFNSIAAGASFAEAMDRDPAVTNIYVNLQQLKSGSTSDKRTDVAQYKRFLVDIDRKVKEVDGRKVNANEEEHAELLKVTIEVNRWISGLLESHPLVADSGNGYHLSWDLRPDAFTSSIPCIHDNQALIKDCLLAVKQRFDSELVDIDSSVSEPEQIIRLEGTHNRRNPETEGRPHRQSRILSRAGKAVSKAQLGLLAAKYEAPTFKAGGGKGPKSDAPLLHPDFDEDAWWDHYEPVFTKVGENNGWQITSICPPTYEGESTGHRHTGSYLSGFRFDGERPEFNCFSDHSEMTFGDVMRKVHEFFPTYKGKLYDWKDDFSAFDIDPVDVMPESAVKPNGHAPEGSGECNSKGTLCPTCNAQLIVGAFDQECKACIEKLEPGTTTGAEEHVLVGNAEGENVYVSVTHMDRLIPQPLEWMWDQRLLKDALNLFAGKPEKCKSLGGCEIAAILSTGRHWPDGKPNTMGPRIVLIMMSEDGLANVIWGRLAAAGADMSRVKAVNGVIVGEDMRRKKKKRLLALKTDLAALRSLVRKYPDAGLIIVDPISSYYGCNANKVQEVKPVLDGMKQLCEDMHIAILAIAHTNKRSDVDALQQVSGDTSVGGSFRAGWTFSEDPDKEGEFLMANNKGNNAKDKSGLRLRPVGKVIRFPDSTEHEYPKIEWMGKTNLRAQDVQDKEKANTKNGNQDRKVSMAKSLLLMKFAQRREYKCSDLYDEASKEDISADTMKRARRQLGESKELDIIVEDRRGSGGGYWWAIYNPEHQPTITPDDVI